MEEQLISFKTAKLAKEKGFNEPSLRFKGLIKDDSEVVKNWNKYVNSLSKPTQSLLQKWLREKHSIFIDIITQSGKNRVTFAYEIKPQSIFADGFNKYEETLEEALFKALIYV